MSDLQSLKKCGFSSHWRLIKVIRRIICKSQIAYLRYIETIHINSSASRDHLVPKPERGLTAGRASRLNQARRVERTRWGPHSALHTADCSTAYAYQSLQLQITLIYCVHYFMCCVIEQRVWYTIRYHSIYLYALIYLITISILLMQY